LKAIKFRLRSQFLGLLKEFDWINLKFPDWKRNWNSKALLRIPNLFRFLRGRGFLFGRNFNWKIFFLDR